MVAYAPTRFLLLAAIASVLAIPLMRRWASGRGDVLEPIVLANVALGVMFVLRPLALIVAGQPLYSGRFDTNPTFDRVLLVALTGCLAYTLGYSSSLGQRLGRRIPAPATELHRDTAWVSASSLIAIGLIGYGVYAVQAGVSPLTILRGGLPPSPDAQTTAYLYSAPNLILPALLLFMYVGTAGRRWLSLGAVMGGGGLLAFAMASSGQRLGLLLLVSCVAVYPMLRSGWRPRTVTLLVFLPVALITVSAMRDVSRTEGGIVGFGSLLESASRSPSQMWTQFTLGADTEMFSALAVELQMVPASVSHEPGSAMLSLVSHPVPRAIWPGKPSTADDVLNLEMGRTSQSGTAGAAFSIFGGFYYDSGFIGVAAYMFCVGIGLRSLYAYLVSHPANDLVRMIYSSMLVLFTIVLMRGNLVHPASFLVFTTFPLIVSSWIASRSSPAAGFAERVPHTLPARTTP
jgi:hypothetical protein